MESQIIHAADHIAGRNSNGNATDDNDDNKSDGHKKVADTLLTVLERLENLMRSSASPINHFHISNNSTCQKGPVISQATQTESFSCDNCSKIFDSNESLLDHTESDHMHSSHSANSQLTDTPSFSTCQSSSTRSSDTL